MTLRATAILWACRLRVEGVMPRPQYDRYVARERAGAPTDELLDECAKLDPATAAELLPERAVNAPDLGNATDDAPWHARGQGPYSDEWKPS